MAERIYTCSLDIPRRETKYFHFSPPLSFGKNDE
jgi:hypothetical protein